MVLPEYLADVAREMQAKSAAIRRDFASHRPSAGENREDLVGQFLTDHLPKRFGVSSGLVISHDGLFSNQADLVVVDQLHNAPLYGSARNKLWPVEAIYALVEVKTNLSPTDLSDAVSKGRRFKKLKRKFCEAGTGQRILDSLFTIWAFDSPASSVLKKNILKIISGIPRCEQPDFIVVPDRVIGLSGSYLEISKLGQAGSSYRRQLESQFGPNLDMLIPESVEVLDLGDNALLAWYVWFDSWLRQAGARLTTLAEYLPPNQIFGKSV